MEHDLLATRMRVAQKEGGAGVAAQPPRLHLLPSLQQGVALQVQRGKRVHQKALPA